MGGPEKMTQLLERCEADVAEAKRRLNKVEAIANLCMSVVHQQPPNSVEDQ